MKNAYLLYNFNPYHNRQVKRFETADEYIHAAESYFIDEKKRNFNYNDGVNTVIEVYCKNNRTIQDNQDNPDYLILTDESNPSKIDSRWFVIDSTKRCGNMYTLSLRRDLVSDSYDNILDCPAYIEKATVNPADPFVFNQESIGVNRIKTRETLLKDDSDCAWVVGYLATDAVDPEAAVLDRTLSGGPARTADYAYDSIASFLSGFPQAGACEFTNPTGALPSSGTPVNRADKYRIDIAYYNGNRTDGNYRAITARWVPGEQISILGNEFGYATEDALYAALPGISTYLAYAKNTIWANIWADTVTQALNNKRSLLASLINSFGSTTFNNPFAQYENKIFKIGDKYYKAKSVIKSSSTVINNTLSMQEDNVLVETVNGLAWDSVLSTTLKCIRTGYEVRKIVLQFNDISEGEINLTLDGHEMGLNNIPYKMFAIPYKKDGEINIQNGLTTFPMAGDLAISMANIISKKYSGAGSLYDIQLLPYCPIRDLIGDNKLLVTNDDRTRYIKDGAANNIGVVYWCEENTFTFDIEHEVLIEDPKVESITEMYRLSSPNWNGQFEFNPAKNGGIKYFNIDCTYKPFTPYIHINPNFGRLYGEDFDDARGLICSGDFSLPQIYDQWQTYELQNKNYQNQFDRQIENIELTQDIAMKKQKWAVGAGALSGALSGASASMFLSGGNLGGAAAGAVLGGALSAAAGMQDLYYQGKLNQEVIDYSKDQFAMNNENIQALPDSLKQVGAYTANNKIFPVLEYYTCTPEEKEAVRMKLYYNGMTVERIGTIREFLQEEESYIKCKIIRINMNEDNHYIEALAEELNKGVFIK